MPFDVITRAKPIEKYQVESYKKISGLIDAYSENDERALEFVRMYIEKAKEECNYKELIQGYEEAIYYDKDIDDKLIYADSAIIAAKNTIILIRFRAYGQRYHLLL